MSDIIRRPCPVCLVSTNMDELKQYGNRCRGCAEAVAATDTGTSYGKFKGQQYSAVMAEQDRQKRIIQRIKDSRKPKPDRLCKNCGGVIPDSREDDFCCRECREEHDKRARKEKKRNEKKEQNPPAPPNYCRNCGKEIPRKNKYCSETCKYLFNQEKLKEGQRERRRLKAMERPANLCKQCGKEITSGRRSYCSRECANAARNARKRQLRQAGKCGQ